MKAVELPPLLHPPAALAWSERLVDMGVPGPTLALWRPEGMSVALGLAQKPEKELRLSPDGSFAIPVFRRQSGGGAVLLYPGVLCWEAVASEAAIDAVHGINAGIRPAYDFLSLPVTEGLARMGFAPFRAGISDLSVRCGDGAVRKIAGTAQLRRRSRVLVHGALLVWADIATMSDYLAFPSSQPDYRDGRGHREFCITLAELSRGENADADSLMAAVVSSILEAANSMDWRVVAIPPAMPVDISELERVKYRNKEWNWHGKRPAR